MTIIEIMYFIGAAVLAILVVGFLYLVRSELSQNRKKFVQFMDFLPDALIVEDEKEIIFANAQANKMLGLERQEGWKGRKLETFIDEIKEVSRNPREGLPRKENFGQVSEIEAKLTDAGGGVHFANIKFVSCLFERKDARLFLIRDITDKKQIEKVLQDTQRGMEKEKMKNFFFTGLSHDLRTPVHLVLASIQLIQRKLEELSEDENSSKIRRYIQIISNNANRLLRLINNIIDTFRLDTGCMELELGRHDIVKFLREIVLNVSDTMVKRGIYFEFSTNAERRELIFDKDKIDRILLNLLSNAVKFTDHGGMIKVQLNISETFFEIRVCDNGIGIPSSKLEEIFKPYFKLASTVKDNLGGSGLGLPLVKSLTELHGGAITVESEEGAGSCFILKFPVLEPAGSVYSEQNSVLGHELRDTRQKIEIELSDIL